MTVVSSFFIIGGYLLFQGFIFIGLVEGGMHLYADIGRTVFDFGNFAFIIAFAEIAYQKLKLRYTWDNRKGFQKERTNPVWLLNSHANPKKGSTNQASKRL